VEELGIALAVERSRLVGNTDRGLAFLPLAPVDRDHLLAVVGLDPPDADDVDERGRLGTDRVVGEIEPERVRHRRAEEAHCERHAGDRYMVFFLIPAFPPLQKARLGRQRPRAGTVGGEGVVVVAGANSAGPPPSPTPPGPARAGPEPLRRRQFVARAVLSSAARRP